MIFRICRFSSSVLRFIAISTVEIFHIIQKRIKKWTESQGSVLFLLALFPTWGGKGKKIFPLFLKGRDPPSPRLWRDRGKRITKPTFGFFSREKKFSRFPRTISPYQKQSFFYFSNGIQNSLIRFSSAAISSSHSTVIYIVRRSISRVLGAAVSSKQAFAPSGVRNGFISSR